jgi:uncharacterized protein YxjI
MKYVITNTHSVVGYRQQFEITYDSGTPLFEAKSSFGKSGSTLTMTDTSGREVASIRKGLNPTAFAGYEVYVGEEHVARVDSLTGEIHADSGVITSQGNFGGGECTLSRDGTEVATTKRQGHWKANFAVDIDDGENQMLFLALILAMAHVFILVA